VTGTVRLAFEHVAVNDPHQGKKLPANAVIQDDLYCGGNANAT
jgi:hypothetical protein